MPVYKLILLLKKRPDMSVQEFRDYYETKHRLIGEKYPAGMVRYVRRYLDPAPGDTAELPYDVITEVWFDNRKIFEAALRNVSSENLDAEVVADEERLFDRPKNRVMTVVEVESDLDRIRAGNS
ncbi:EthD domain-containing protein [Nocardia alni]|uniref:EthD domain-containing protein n=1 Tax=Nocardia alni TaxID=2815723 RepID=UPI001C21DF90|nr:EthD domain-containing protein [Nocardia alni]